MIVTGTDVQLNAFFQILQIMADPPSGSVIFDGDRDLAISAAKEFGLTLMDGHDLLVGEFCPCGNPLHYQSEGIRQQVTRLISELGKEVKVIHRGESYLVSRHYIALHGLKGSDLSRFQRC